MLCVFSGVCRLFSSSIHHQQVNNGTHHDKDLNENIHPSCEEILNINNHISHDKTCNGVLTSCQSGFQENVSIPESSAASLLHDIPTKCLNLKSHFI